MPHETKESAEQLAKEQGIDKSQVVKTKIGWFIAPQGIKSKTAKQVYGNNRASGMSAEQAAKIAWSVENRLKNAKNSNS